LGDIVGDNFPSSYADAVGSQSVLRWFGELVSRGEFEGSDLVRDAAAFAAGRPSTPASLGGLTEFIAWARAILQCSATVRDRRAMFSSLLGLVSQGFSLQSVDAAHRGLNVLGDRIDLGALNKVAQIADLLSEVLSSEIQSPIRAKDVRQRLLI